MARGGARCLLALGSKMISSGGSHEESWETRSPGTIVCFKYRFLPEDSATAGPSHLGYHLGRTVSEKG